MHIKGEDEAASGSFAFEEVDFSPAATKEAASRELWSKWGLDQHSYMKRLSFDEFFSREQSDVFFKDLFSSPEAQKVLATLAGRNAWAPVGPVRSVRVRELSCGVTNMDFFQRLHDIAEDPPVVRDTGALMKCFDEFVDGVCLSDELRKLLVMEDSDHYEEFGEKERNEFIFHVFRRVCIGGGMCQYEDELTPYMDMTKLLYKDLVGVQKNPSTKQLEVTSHVYQLEEIDADFELFPSSASREHSFCYLSIEPTKRHVTVWYLAHMPLF